MTTRTLKLQEALQSSLNLADCQNHSLCHGLIGNLNILLDIKRLNRELHVPDDIFCIYKVAFSIAKAAKVIHDDSCKELVLKLVEEEDRYFQKDHLNWLDLRNDSHTLSPSYWCHGAPGILLGRA
ncbi:hypothetical protein DT075_02330 [Bacillus licheniformis]|nr:hypothetical protein DT075_02330 [Bacillus licheniformis]